MAAAAAIGASGAARADVTPQEAQTLQTRLRDWIASIRPPGAPPPDHPIEVAAVGDHFAITSFISQPQPKNVQVTLQGPPPVLDVKPIDATRWAILDGHFYSGVHGEAQSDAKSPFKSYDMTVGDDVVKGAIDPTFATPCVYDQTVKGLAFTFVTANGANVVRIDSGAFHAAMAPAAGGKQGADWKAVYGKIAGTLRLPDGRPATIAAGEMSLVGRLDGLVPSELFSSLQAFQTMAPLLRPDLSAAPAADVPPPPVPMAARPAAHALLTAFANALSGAEQTLALKQMEFVGNGRSVTIERLSIGLGGGTQADKLALRMPIALDGLRSPELPPGFLRAYQPRRLAFTPRVSGVSAKALTALISRAIDADDWKDPQLRQMVADLFGTSPPEVGVDDIILDMGPGTLSGSAAAVMSMSNAVSGHALLRLVGYDALLADANARPEMKKAAPALILAKGLSKPDGAALIWNIVWQDKKLLVNGTDVSAMIPK